MKLSKLFRKLRQWFSRKCSSANPAKLGYRKNSAVYVSSSSRSRHIVSFTDEECKHDGGSGGEWYTLENHPEESDVDEEDVSVIMSEYRREFA